MAGVDGRIHTTYNQTIAATGRLSSTDPNLQNIPIRTEEGRRTRRPSWPGPVTRPCWTADYSQIELRIMAHLSGTRRWPRRSRPAATSTPRPRPGVRRARRRGHGRAAQQDQGDELRAGLRPVRLRAVAAAAHVAGGGQAFMDEYFEQFGGIRDYLDVVDAGPQDGYTETILGRRRYLPDLRPTTGSAREMAERMALNAPIQTSPRQLRRRCPGLQNTVRLRYRQGGVPSNNCARPPPCQQRLFSNYTLILCFLFRLGRNQLISNPAIGLWTYRGRSQWKACFHPPHRRLASSCGRTRCCMSRADPRPWAFRTTSASSRYQS